MNISICAILAPFEIPYIKEWLEYHFKLGINSAYLYLNNWSNEEIEYCRNTDFSGKCYFTKFDGCVQQLNAYNTCISRAISDKVDWLAMIDCDEFICLNSNESLISILNRYDNAISLGVNWRLFGSNGIDYIENELSVLKRFTKSEATLNKHVKQITNIKMLRERGLDFRMLNPHFGNRPSLNTSGEIFTGPFSNSHLDQKHDIEINHYITKSREECKSRRTHRRADTPSPREEGWEAFFNAHDKNQIENLTALNFFQKKFQNLMAFQHCLE